MLIYGGTSDFGCEREINEDFIHAKEIDKENDVLFAVVADGAGTVSTKFQSASIAALEIESVVDRVYSNNPDAILEHPETILSEAVISAGRTLGIFRVIDEEKYAGFAASVSCVLITGNKITIAHSGNTRVHLIRYNKKTDEYNCIHLTKDQTKGMELVDAGKLSFNDYHLSVERLLLTGGLGIAAEPNVQTFTTNIKDNDFILMTTDGIHNAIRADVFFEVIKRSSDCEEAVKALIEGAKLQKYEDNMSGLLIWKRGE